MASQECKEKEEEKISPSSLVGSTAGSQIITPISNDILELKSLFEQSCRLIQQLAVDVADLKREREGAISTQSASTKTVVIDSANAAESSATTSVPDTATVSAKTIMEFAKDIITLKTRDDLPSPKLRAFSGDPHEYVGFMKQFEIYVEGKTSDPGKRLLQLHEHCTGRPQQIIRACLSMEPELGYRRARELLAEKYGKPSIIFHGLIDTLLHKCQNVRDDADSLDDLAFQMSECRENAVGLGKGGELNSDILLGSLAKNFPSQLSADWTKTAGDIWDEGGEPGFDDMLKFITKRARNASSYFGKITSEIQKKQKFQPKPQMPLRTPERPAFLRSLSIVKKDITCTLCQAAHQLTECQQFQNSSVGERWDIAKRSALCFNCLRKGHLSQHCRMRRCSIPGCDKRHNPLLHVEDGASASPTSCFLAATDYTEVELATIPVSIETPRGWITTVALLDSGAQTSFVSERFVKNHGMVLGNATVTTKAFEGEPTVKTRKRGAIRIRSLDNAHTVEINTVYSTNDIAVRRSDRLNEEAAKWPHLKDIVFPKIEENDVNLIIGGNVPEVYWPLDSRFAVRKAPFAFKSILGWVMYGPMGQKRLEKKLSTLGIEIERPTISEQLARLYDSDFQDVATEAETMSQDDRKALEIAQAGCNYTDGKIEVPIPWRSQLIEIPNNYVSAKRRLTHLQTRLLKDEKLRNEYSEVLRSYLAKGYMEKIDYPGRAKPKEWYMPHYPVFNPQKPGKLRIVYDCAAKHQGRCLNDAILTGCDLTLPLVNVIMRFRARPVAVSADIEEMFLQVKVPEQDRDALRILWRDDCDKNAKPECYRFTVHPFGVTSSPFCANFALRKTAEWCGSSFDERVRQAVNQDFYVDDCLASFDSPGEANEYIHQLSEMLGMAGFRLTKWMSNNLSVVKRIRPSELNPSLKDICGPPLPTESVGVTLGLE